MTPERAEWLAEQPKEERKVREAIKQAKSDIRFAKFELNNREMNVLARWHYREAIARQKVLLMALKRQIAVRVIETEMLTETEGGLKRGIVSVCPSCGMAVRKQCCDFHCPLCGQKLEGLM